MKGEELWSSVLYFILRKVPFSKLEETNECTWNSELGKVKFYFIQREMTSWKKERTQVFFSFCEDLYQHLEDKDHSSEHCVFITDLYYVSAFSLWILFCNGYKFYICSELFLMYPWAQDPLWWNDLFSRLLFGGSLPHYFYRALDRYISDDVALAPIKQLILERLIFMPLFQILALYMLARLEVSFLYEYFLS